MPAGEQSSQSSESSGIPKTKSASGPGLGYGEGLGPLINRVLELRRFRALNTKDVSRLTGIREETIQRFEAFDVGCIRVSELFQIIAVLNCRFRFELVPLTPPKAAMPAASSKRILAEYDRLIARGKARVFYKDQPDKEHPKVLWNIVGDIEKNGLYVVASNPSKKVRFAKLAEDSGGWSIHGQIFGIDAETEHIAGELAEELMREHATELT
jgi:DNA-binding Xre family transcriptional regulator